jgi:HD-GYP domain-containing protein (c-di-GMP phosphodiesterase class II)/tRNA A-37 threonylcarbamoyl transferase component Bud32
MQAGLLTGAEVGEFLGKVDDRLPSIVTRERTADALAALGYITGYQKERALAGFTRGLLLGNYRVLDRLNSGTVGTVFLGEHALMKRRVAIKLLQLDETVPPDLVARFVAEARMLGGLHHPHVITAYDAGFLPADGPGQLDSYYLVLELVTGGDLENFIYKNGAQPAGVGCEWGRQLAAGLHAAHTAGLVHRDVKPSNILLTDDLRAKVVDFGLAREFDSSRTRHGSLLGTLEFLAPEQFADAPTAGPPADVYSLGATLFWVLSGQLPLDKMTTTAAAIEAIRTGKTRRLRDVCPTAPADLDILLGRMLSRIPTDRPTAAEAAEALARFATPSVFLSKDEAAKPIPDGQPEAAKLRGAVAQLEHTLKAKAADAEKARVAVLAGLAAAAAARPWETPGHIRRVTSFARSLAVVLQSDPDWVMLADAKQLDDILRAVAAHDLGLVGVPDAILLKQTPLDALERPAYEAHPRVGADILFAVAKESGAALPFLRVALAVVRHHHERWDGAGFPDKLAATAIPPAARLAAVAIAYDDFRRGIPGVPGLAHKDAVDAILQESGGAFDPKVVDAFAVCADEFERVYASVPDRNATPTPGPLTVTATSPEPAPQPAPPSPGTPSAGRLRWGGAKAELTAG